MYTKLRVQQKNVDAIENADSFQQNGPKPSRKRKMIKLVHKNAMFSISIALNERGRG